MHVTFLQALLVAIWIALVMSRAFLGGATTTLRFSPMMTGLVVGIVFNDVHNAMIATAAIQLIYMGVFSRWTKAVRACHCNSNSGTCYTTR